MCAILNFVLSNPWIVLNSLLQYYSLTEQLVNWVNNVPTDSLVYRWRWPSDTHHLRRSQHGITRLLTPYRVWPLEVETGLNAARQELFMPRIVYRNQNNNRESVSIRVFVYIKIASACDKSTGPRAYHLPELRNVGELAVFTTIKGWDPRADIQT